MDNQDNSTKLNNLLNLILSTKVLITTFNSDLPSFFQVTIKQNQWNEIQKIAEEISNELKNKT